MDFELSAEQRDIQKAARAFAKGEFDRDLALKHELAHSFPIELWQKAAKLGFVGIHYPEQYGGQGYGALENVLVTEEFCRVDSGLGACVALGDLGAEIILRSGNDEQRRKYLTRLTSGQSISAVAFTEPDHGSDITSVGTTAVRDGDSWVITGTKMFISNGNIADFVVVLCQTDPNADPAYRGMTSFIVDTPTPGFTAADTGDKMGIRMTTSALLTFDNVRVPAENLVGKLNHGFYNSMGFFAESRLEVGAVALGCAEGAFDRALEYVKSRKQFGQRIADFQVTQHKIADMATKIEAARMMVYRAAWAQDHGKGEARLASMAKFYAARIAVEVSEEAVQLLGGYGLLTENEVERIYRDARVMEIVEGTREIQKNTIAKAYIGRAAG